MILGSGGRIKKQTHIVVPAQKPGTMLSRVRASVVLSIDAPAQTFGVWVCPNPRARHNWWEFESVGRDPSINVMTALGTVGMQHESSGEIQQTRITAVSGSFDEFLLEGSWDSAAADEQVALDIEFLRQRYGSDHAFILVQFERSGTYEFEWTWFGEAPFVQNTLRAEEEAGDVIVIMGNSTRILWCQPDGGHTRGPPKQRSVRDAQRLCKLNTKVVPSPWYLIAALIPAERRRNDDLTAESCAQAPESEEPYSCCLC